MKRSTIKGSPTEGSTMKSIPEQQRLASPGPSQYHLSRYCQRLFYLSPKAVIDRSPCFDRDTLLALKQRCMIFVLYPFSFSNKTCNVYGGNAFSSFHLSYLSLSDDHGGFDPQRSLDMRIGRPMDLKASNRGVTALSLFPVARS